MPSKNLRTKAVLIHSPVTRQSSVDTDITMTDAPSDDYDLESPPTDAYLSTYDATETTKDMGEQFEETNSTPIPQKKEKYVVKIFDTDEEFYELRNRRAKDYGMRFINKYDPMPVPIYDDKPPKEDVDVKGSRQNSAYKEDPLKKLISGFTKEAQTILEQSASSGNTMQSMETSDQCHEKITITRQSDPSIIDLFRSGGATAVTDHINRRSLKENSPISTTEMANKNSKARRRARRAAFGSSMGNSGVTENCFAVSDDGPDKAPLKDEEPQESLPAPALASILRALATHQLESLHRKSEELDRQTELQEEKIKTMETTEGMIRHMLHKEKSEDGIPHNVKVQQIGSEKLGHGDLQDVPIIQSLISKPQGQEIIAHFLRGQTGVHKMEAQAKVKRFFDDKEKNEHHGSNLVGTDTSKLVKHKTLLEIEIDKTPSSSKPRLRPPPGLPVPDHLREKDFGESPKTPCKKKAVVAQTVGGRRHANKRNSKTSSKSSSTSGVPHMASEKAKSERLGDSAYYLTLINFIFPSTNPTPDDLLHFDYTNTLAQGEEPSEVIYYATRSQAEESCRTKGMLPGWREGFRFNPKFIPLTEGNDVIRVVYEKKGSKMTCHATRSELRDTLRFGKLPEWEAGFRVSEVCVVPQKGLQALFECAGDDRKEEPSPDQLPSVGSWKGFNFDVDPNGRERVIIDMHPQNTERGAEYNMNFNRGNVLNVVEKLINGYPKSPENEDQVDLKDEVETVKAESEDEDDFNKTPEERKREGMAKFFKMVSGQDQSGLTRILHSLAEYKKGAGTLHNLPKGIHSNGDSSDEGDYEDDGPNSHAPIPPIAIVDLDETFYSSPNSSPPTSPVLNPNSSLPFTFTPPITAPTSGLDPSPLPNITFPPVTPARTTRNHHSTPLVEMREDPDAILSHRTPKTPKPKPAHTPGKRRKFNREDVDILLDIIQGRTVVDWDDLRARSKIAADQEGALTVAERKLWGIRHLMRHCIAIRDNERALEGPLG